MTLSPAIRDVGFRLDESQCVGCAICADVCREGALLMTGRDLLPRWTASRCNGCKICEKECPTAAILITLPP